MRRVVFLCGLLFISCGAGSGWIDSLVALVFPSAPSSALPAPAQTAAPEAAPDAAPASRTAPEQPDPRPEVAEAESEPSPAVPIRADPAEILEWPQETWRRADYELFAWERFPQILIFDTANYDAQDRLLKRLAFFVEKKGFRGRLAPDEEIAALHAWNAHDYRAADLAAFFDLAQKEHFPLHAEERSLEAALLAAAVIEEGEGGYRAGEGALISISRESPPYLRARFMAHEGYHGLFFIDPDFRAFCQERWAGLARTPRRVLLSFFDYQKYDISDEYLVVNEFMAHVLQQSVAGAAVFFGKTIPERISATPWRQSVLPEKDEESGAWPLLAEAFTAEAKAFSAYAAARWGYAAGRVWPPRP